MKAVIGLALIFVGLTIGYLVITGRLPSTSSSTPSSSPSSGTPSGNTSYQASQIVGL